MKIDKVIVPGYMDWYKFVELWRKGQIKDSNETILFNWLVQSNLAFNCKPDIQKRALQIIQKQRGIK